MRSITNEELITHIENRGRKIRSENKKEDVDNLKELVTEILLVDRVVRKFLS